MLPAMFPFLSEERAAHAALEDLHRHHTPVRVEMEQSGIRFKTVISLRKDVVAVQKPMGFGVEVHEGTVLRVRLPDRKHREVRLVVSNPHFELPNRRAFFVCPLPKGFAEQSGRQAERYSTHRFRNLELVLPEQHGRYRVYDLSMGGCRIATGRENVALTWEEGEAISPAMLSVGNAIRIDVHRVVPRVLLKNAVGLQFDLDPGGKGHDQLQKLVAWLDKWEDRQSRVVG